MNNKKQKIKLSIILVSIITLSSCWYNHKWETIHPYGQNDSAATTACDSAGVISYSITIQPIIVSNCATGSACHVSHGTAPTNYNNFASVQTDAQATGGNGIMDRIALPSSNSLHMPQNNQTTLLSCDTIKIRKWIKQGCQNN